MTGAVLVSYLWGLLGLSKSLICVEFNRKIKCTYALKLYAGIMLESLESKLQAHWSETLEKTRFMTNPDFQRWVFYFPHPYPRTTGHHWEFCLMSMFNSWVYLSEEDDENMLFSRMIHFLLIFLEWFQLLNLCSWPVLKTNVNRKGTVCLHRGGQLMKLDFVLLGFLRIITSIFTKFICLQNW